jgi:hypothetical protein
VTGDVARESPDRREAEMATHMRIPDAIQPITAYRAWRTDSYGRLRSFNHPGGWITGGWTVARCRRECRVAPREGCTCGLYATKELDDVLVLAESIGTATAIVGIVELAGKVIEHDRGYRAGLGRVAEILPIEGQRARNEAVAHRFGVPIGEEIPGSSIRTAAGLKRGPSHVRSSGGWVYVIGWALVAVSNAFSRFAEAQGIDPSGWWFGAIVLAAGLAFAAMLWVQHRWGRRFTRQLRQFGGGSPGSKP